MNAMNDMHRRLMVSVDMESYSRKDSSRQYRSQMIFRHVVDTAVAKAGLDHSQWLIQQAGDSELAILPPGTSEPAVVGALAERMDALLRDHNRDLLPAARVRLRMAIHEGPVHLDGANGFPGEAVVTVSRLRDAEPLRKIFQNFPDAGVALIVSERIYEDIVKPQYDGIRRDRFRRVRVTNNEKGFDSTAWISVINEDISQADLDDGPPPGDRHDESLVRHDSPAGAAKRPPSVASGSKYAIDQVNARDTIIGDNGTVWARPDDRGRR